MLLSGTGKSLWGEKERREKDPVSAAGKALFSTYMLLDEQLRYFSRKLGAIRSSLLSFFTACKSTDSKHGLSLAFLHICIKLFMDYNV